MLWDNKLQWQKYFKAIIESIWTSCVKIRGKIKMTILCKQRFMHVCQKNVSAPLFNVKTLLFSWNLPLHLCCTEWNPQLTWCFACQWNMHVNWFHSSLYTGLLIFRGKKSKISRDFQGQIRGKIGQFRGIFAGKKIKIRGTIGRFQAIFAGEKSKFAGKSAHFEGF